MDNLEEKRRKIIKTLDELFEKAKAADEFEFVCTLLNVEGLEAPGWDPLIETHQLVNDMMGLISAPLINFTKLRLALLTYCHLTEVKDIYKIIFNLISVIEGKRYSPLPFRSLGRTKGKGPMGKYIPPSAKKIVNSIKEHAEINGESKLSEIFNAVFNDEIRNSFFHSDYTLYDDEYRTKQGRFKIDGMIQRSVKIDHLVEIINLGLAFYSIFMNVYENNRFSYRENKVVKGRLGQNGEYIDIEILAKKEGGVYGIRTPPQSE